MEYVYLLQEREFVNTNENVYKIGRTKQVNLARFRQYPKNSILYLQSFCGNCVLCEKEIMKRFAKKYKRRSELGREYFEGDVRNMMADVYLITINSLKKEKKDSIL